jgi:hypothetical protein
MRLTSVASILFNFLSRLSSGTYVLFTKNPYCPSIKLLSFNLKRNINTFPYKLCIALGTSYVFLSSESSNSDILIPIIFFASSSNIIHIVDVV